MSESARGKREERRGRRELAHPQSSAASCWHQKVKIRAWEPAIRRTERQRWVRTIAGVLLISTETLLEVKLATARSDIPSPLKSPTATEKGPLPTPKYAVGRKVPSPMPSSTNTLSKPRLATARSWIPSR